MSYKIDLLKLAEKYSNKKRIHDFIIKIYNNNFELKTSNLNEINSAYKLREDYPELNIKILRKDYSTIHKITIFEE